VDLPTLLPEYDLGLKKSRNSTLQLNNSNIQGSKMGSSSLQIKTDNVDRFSGTKATPNNEKSGESQHFELDINSVPGDESSKSNFNAPPEHAHPHGLESRNHSLKSSYNLNALPEHEYNGAPVVSPCLTSITDKPENETLRKLRSFKQFDTVVDTSDHYFVKNNSTMLQVS
jgi:hypothetical protein